MGFLGKPVGVGQGADGLVLLLVLGAFHHLRDADDDTAGVEVVIEGFALTQEFWAEKQIEPFHTLGAVFHIQSAGVAHGNGALDDHDGVGVDIEDGVDDGLDGGGVEEVLLAVVVGGGGDDDEVGITVAGLLVEGSLEAQRLVGQIVLDVVVLDGRLLVVDEVDAFLDHIDGGDVVMLCQQGGNTKSYIAGSGN